MDNETLAISAQALALSAAMTGGVFQSFSDFVMRGLEEEGVAGAKGMQGLNRTVLRSVFVVMLFAIAPLALGLAWFVGAGASPQVANQLWAGAWVYTLGVPLVTMLGNVPMNERLARFDVSSVQGLAYWRTYQKGWTRWNTLRTLASYGAALLFAAAALQA